MLTLAAIYKSNRILIIFNALLLIHLFVMFIKAAPSSPNIDDAPELAIELSLATLDIDSVLEVEVSSPIFHQSREMWTPPAKIKPQPTLPPPNYRFSGFFNSPDKDSRAFLKSPNANKSIVVSKNDELDGWIVEAITSTYIEISNDKQRVLINRNGVVTDSIGNLKNTFEIHHQRF
jgi:hypothetical protein